MVKREKSLKIEDESIRKESINTLGSGVAQPGRARGS